MAVSVTFDNASIRAEPGTQASCAVLVRNTGPVVDRILLDVLGDAKDWVTVEPPELSLMPGTSETARVLFRPPRASRLRAGEFPFALRAYSREDPEGSAIVEGAVTLGSFSDIRAELVPKTSHGRRHGRHRLIVENRGNTGSGVELTAADPDDALAFRFRPDLLYLEPSTAVSVKLRADPRSRFLKGASKSLPFQACVLGGEAEPVTVEGAVLQRQIMPEWLLPLIAIAAAAAAALTALWLLVFKPEVHSAAVQAVAAQTHSLAVSAAKASTAASKADQAAANANAAARSSLVTGHPKASASPSLSGGGAAAAAAPAPVSTLVPASVAPGKTGTYPYKLTGHQTLSVSDMVLENPAGSTGTMNIQSGSSPLFEFALADFRDLDYHFVQPLVFSVRHPLEIVVSCANAGSIPCTPALSFSGTIRSSPP